MRSIQIVEPHPLLRLGIVQALSSLRTEYVLQSTDYSSIFDVRPEGAECAILVLSITTFKNLHRLIPDICSAFSPTSILLLSDDETMPQWVQTLPAPVAGYLARHAVPAILEASVRLVLAGGRCFPLSQHKTESKRRLDADVSSGAVRAVMSTKLSCVSIECEILGVTPRQYEVLVLLARGYPIKLVSQHLHISVATTRAHTESLYQRLNVHSRNEAVYIAVERGASLGWPNMTSALEYAQHVLPNATQTSAPFSDEADAPVLEEKKASASKKV
ncbi:response regulator transcription factor [Pusillimonas sp. ANT_WB101]|uniref:helix-turn-helix transcriptional regulator n=1 Tax=Pusillimonas sp. ANT_WB101 TaxID=2597356 RepID=UPI0011EE012B|nr:response regulator transcription factor [Pusillimonas sp. ANT_WB101]KAA0911101.1 response regulator transcription factor [Pusillimonas sp. ANT_WB101]